MWYNNSYKDCMKYTPKKMRERKKRRERRVVEERRQEEIMRQHRQTGKKERKDKSKQEREKKLGREKQEDENEGRGDERGEKVSGANWEAWLHLQAILWSHSSVVMTRRSGLCVYFCVHVRG